MSAHHQEQILQPQHATTDSIDTPSLRASIRDGTAHASMLGFGENYIGVFAIFLQATAFQIALISSLPQAVSALGQLISLRLIKASQNRKKLVVFAAIANGVIWLPMALLPLLFDTQTAIQLLLIATIIYFATAGLGGPAWNSWIGDLLPANRRGAFFGIRNRNITISTFISLIVAGKILHYSASLGYPAWGFAIIFILAGIARGVSVLALKKQDEPIYQPSPSEFFSIFAFFRRSFRSNFAKFAYFTSAINASVAFAAPFFALYMLRDLKFSYGEFTAITGVGVLSQFVAMRYWGVAVDHFGTKKILNICGVGVAIIPLLWLVSTGFYWLLCVQLFGGFVWAGFSLASASFIFDAVTPARRARCAAYQGVINGAMVLFASLAGGLAASYIPAKFEYLDSTFSLSSNLLVIFAFSALLRLIAATLILPQFHEVREVRPITHRELIFSLAQIKPIAGMTLEIEPEKIRKKVHPHTPESEKNAADAK